ncbi:MAG: hypothetical protein IAE78_32800 [Myxococcus sp.]|nr:hypothetical protein [Myxococcus sp.]
MNLRLPLTLSLAVTFFPAVGAAQTCLATVFGDGKCDCGCGVVDSDCPAGAKFTACEVTHCGPGTVPWEHNPHTCMMSACGDGWNDTAGNEVCDDGNALASGGCAANCRAVNPGYVCGAGASGCRLAPADGGQGDAGAPDAGAPAIDAGATVADGGQVLGPTATTQGCAASGGGAQMLVVLAGVMASRRRRSVSSG